MSENMEKGTSKGKSMHTLQNDYPDKFTNNKYSLKFSPRPSKWELIGFTILLSVSVILTVFVFWHSSLKRTDNLSNLLFLLFCLLALLSFIIYLFPSIWILTIISLRTKSHKFIKLLAEFLLLAIAECLVLPFFWIIASGYSSLENLGYLLCHLALLIILYIGFLVRRDPFWFSQYSKRSTTMITNQATKILEEKDGYSKRPIFSLFLVLEKMITDSSQFHHKFDCYARILAKEGIIISWQVKNDTYILYPRFFIPYPFYFRKFWVVYRYLRKIRNLTDLTTIKISYSSAQISINVSIDDYNLIERQVTFHILAEQILSKFKQSILAFLNDELDISISVLFSTSTSYN